MEIAALVSGGVDSSVVVHQLKEAGYDPTIFYIRIGMEDKDGYIDCPIIFRCSDMYLIGNRCPQSISPVLIEKFTVPLYNSYSL